MSPAVIGLLAVAIPMGTGAAGWLASAPLRSKDEGGGGASGAAVALASVATLAWVSKTPVFPPTEAADWRAYAAVALVPLALASGRLPAWASRLGRLAIALLLPWFQFANLREYTWSPNESVVWTLGMGLGAFLLWEATRALAQKRGEGVFLPLHLVLVGAASAAAVAGSGSALLGQQLGGLAASIGGMGLIGSFRAHRDRAGLVDGFAPLWFALVAEGLHFAELTPGSALCLGFALLAPWLWEVRPPEGRVAAVLGRLALTALVLAWPLSQVVYALMNAPDPSAPPY